MQYHKLLRRKGLKQLGGRIQQKVLAEGFGGRVSRRIWRRSFCGKNALCELLLAEGFGGKCLAEGSAERLRRKSSINRSQIGGSCHLSGDVGGMVVFLLFKSWVHVFAHALFVLEDVW